MSLANISNLPCFISCLSSKCCIPQLRFEWFDMKPCPGAALTTMEIQHLISLSLTSLLRVGGAAGKKRGGD